MADLHWSTTHIFVAFLVGETTQPHFMIQAYGHPKFYTIRIFRRGERERGREGVCVHRRLQLLGIRFSGLGPMDSRFTWNPIIIFYSIFLHSHKVLIFLFSCSFLDARDVFACIDSDFMCTFHLWWPCNMWNIFS